MDEEFMKLAKEIHNEKITAENRLKNSLEYKVKCVYIDFTFWCLAFNKDENDYKNFKVYLNETNQEINFWIKKKFLEKYFNFVFEFINEKNKWFISNLNKYIGVNNGF